MSLETDTIIPLKMEITQVEYRLRIDKEDLKILENRIARDSAYLDSLHRRLADYGEQLILDLS